YRQAGRHRRGQGEAHQQQLAVGLQLHAVHAGQGHTQRAGLNLTGRRVAKHKANRPRLLEVRLGAADQDFAVRRDHQRRGLAAELGGYVLEDLAPRAEGGIEAAVRQVAEEIDALDIGAAGGSGNDNPTARLETDRAGYITDVGRGVGRDAAAVAEAGVE